MENIIGLFSLLLSGGLIKAIYDKFWMTKKDEHQALIMLVDQLQKNVNSNNEKYEHLSLKYDSLQKEVDDWKAKYYTELEQKNNLKIEVQKLTNQLNRFTNKIAEA